MEPPLLPLPFLLLAFVTIAPSLPSPLASHQPLSPASSFATLASPPLPPSPPFSAQQQASITNNNTYIISSSSSPSQTLYSSSSFNPSMAIVIVVLLSAFFFMGFFSVYVRRCTAEDGFDLSSTSNAGRSALRNGNGNSNSSSSSNNLMGNNLMSRFSFGSSGSEDVEEGEGLNEQGRGPLMVRATRGGGVDEEMVRGLPTVRYRRSFDAKSSTSAPSSKMGSIPAKCSSNGAVIVVSECVVCLSDFQEDEVLRWLPGCGHSFHQDCIDMWLFSHTTCPLCRTSLLVDQAIPPKNISGASSTGNPGTIAAPASAVATNTSALMVESTGHLLNHLGAHRHQQQQRQQQQELQQHLHHRLAHQTRQQQQLQQQSHHDLADQHRQQQQLHQGLAHHRHHHQQQELEQPASIDGTAASPSATVLIIQDCSSTNKRLQRSHSTGHSLMIRGPSIMLPNKCSAKPLSTIISTSNWALHSSSAVLEPPTSSAVPSSSANVIQALAGSLLHRSRSYTTLRSIHTS